MDILRFVKKVHDSCVGEVEYIDFDSSHRRSVILLSLYGSMIELTGGFISLVDGKFRTAGPSVFRTFLESYVNFVNLLNEPTYGYRMEASNHEAWLKIYKAARGGDNPYLESISKIPDLDSMIESHEAQLQSFRDQGYGALGICDRFIRAGLENEYRAMYNSLSADAHSNIKALLNRHLEVTDKGHNIVFYQDFEIEEFLPELDFVGSTLIDASLKLHDLFNSGREESFKELLIELESVRKGYLGHRN